MQFLLIYLLTGNFIQVQCKFNLQHIVQKSKTGETVQNRCKMTAIFLLCYRNVNTLRIMWNKSNSLLTSAVASENIEWYHTRRKCTQMKAVYKNLTKAMQPSPPPALRHTSSQENPYLFGIWRFIIMFTRANCCHYPEPDEPMPHLHTQFL
jgi:hypothetical protein